MDLDYSFSCGKKNVPVSEQSSPTDLDSNELIKFDPTYLCLHFLPYNIKIPFKVNVDNYSVLEVKNFWDLMQNKLKYRAVEGKPNEKVREVDVIVQMR